MAYPQMFEQRLDIVRGEHGVNSWMKVLPFDDDAVAMDAPAVAGRGVHITENNGWALGASGNQLPFFLWNGRDDLDVNVSGVSPVTGRMHYRVHFPTGKATAFFAGGGFELQTTEYDRDRDYLPNDPLTLTAEGLVTNEDAVPYVASICGFATVHENPYSQQWTADPQLGSTGANAYRMDVLTFAGWFIPPFDVDAAQAWIDAQA